MSLDEAWERVYEAHTAWDAIEARLYANKELIWLRDRCLATLDIEGLLMTESSIIKNNYHLARLYTVVAEGKEYQGWDWKSR